MKKTLCALLCLALMVGVAACLFGCSKEVKYETYYFYEMTDGGVKYTAETLQKDLDAEGRNVKIEDIFYLRMYEDGTAIWCSMGIETKMKYNDTELWPEDEETARAKYTISGDTVTVQEDAATMIFKKH